MLKWLGQGFCEIKKNAQIEDFFKFDIFIFEGPTFDDLVIKFFDQVSFAKKTALLLVNVSYSQALDRIASMEYHAKNLSRQSGVGPD